MPGGSTITQQVAKYLLKDSSYNIGRKVREAILAFRLESTLSKQQILEIYLNSIFLGRNAYGVQAASRAYFDKDVNELTLPEAAYLAVLPRAPANYDPERATQKALGRRAYVLGEMYKNGYITEDQERAAEATPLGTIRYGSNEKFHQQGGYFMEEVRRELIKKFGEDTKDGSNSLYGGGLWVRSSMDPVSLIIGDARRRAAPDRALRDRLLVLPSPHRADEGLPVGARARWATATFGLAKPERPPRRCRARSQECPFRTARRSPCPPTSRPFIATSREPEQRGDHALDGRGEGLGTRDGPRLQGHVVRAETDDLRRHGNDGMQRGRPRRSAKRREAHRRGRLLALKCDRCTSRATDSRRAD